MDASELEQAAPPKGSAILAEITYYTDPLCCWSWGYEPQLRLLRHAYAGRIAWRIRMGCMIGDWHSFSDPVNSIHRPSHMGPLWIQAGHITGMPIEADIWVNDPPLSSLQPCLAVKAMELQSPTAADLYLRRLREAVMLESRNISHSQVLLEVANELGTATPDLFQYEDFVAAFGSPNARSALEDDVREARFRGVGRFPCLVIRTPGRQPNYLVGWRPYPVLRDLLSSLVPDLGPPLPIEGPDAYRRYWGHATEREILEAMGQHVSGGVVGAASSGNGMAPPA